MKKIIYLTPFFLFLFSMLDSVLACTSFAVYSTRVFYGMNFDFADVAMKFFLSANGDMKTFHLAFERMFGDQGIFVKTAGMNTRGLFGACQEQHPLTEKAGEPADGAMFVFQLYEQIDGLTCVEDVETILETTEIINLPGLSLHNLFADIHGKALITEAGPQGNAITQMEGRYMAMTNFPNYLLGNRPFTEAEGKGADRYRICHDYLQTTVDDFTVDHGLELLHKACNRDPEYPTACSMVFDPQNNHVYIGLHGDFKRIHRLSMETGIIELWRGTSQQPSRTLAITDEGVLASNLINHFR